MKNTVIVNYYIESNDTDPYRNLAQEQFVFDFLGKENNFFMLWQNRPSIIIGKHQNAMEEINADFVKENNITVVRRLSGGGAVYHDLGNLNFTFVTRADKQEGIDFSAFCAPIQKALDSLGVPVDISGRNDMTIEGWKFSGNAQYLKDGRVMHHGTILYDSDLQTLSQALKPKNDKIESKGVKSVRSGVVNVRPYMKNDMSMTEFRSAFKKRLIDILDLREFNLKKEHEAAIEELKEKVYSQWSWNYGKSPQYTTRKTRRVEGCGKIEIFLDIAKEGIISNITFYGDFFSNGDLSELENKFKGCHFQYEEIKSLVKDLKINEYFHALKNDDFLALLFE